MLYRLLAEREPIANISHKRTPTLQQHRGFVRNRPYAHWYLIEVNKEQYVGAIYLTQKDEIGVFLFQEFQRKGFGSRAVRMLMKKHRRKAYYANIAPLNYPSTSMFCDLGFRYLQMTLIHEPD